MRAVIVPRGDTSSSTHLGHFERSLSDHGRLFEHFASRVPKSIDKWRGVVEVHDGSSNAVDDGPGRRDWIRYMQHAARSEHMSNFCRCKGVVRTSTDGPCMDSARYVLGDDATHGAWSDDVDAFEKHAVGMNDTRIGYLRSNPVRTLVVNVCNHDVHARSSKGSRGTRSDASGSLNRNREAR
jgi:hypothetical protein